MFRPTLLSMGVLALSLTACGGSDGGSYSASPSSIAPTVAPTLSPTPTITASPVPTATPVPPAPMRATIAYPAGSQQNCAPQVSVILSGQGTYCYVNVSGGVPFSVNPIYRIVVDSAPAAPMTLTYTLINPGSSQATVQVSASGTPGSQFAGGSMHLIDSVGTSSNVLNFSVTQ